MKAQQILCEVYNDTYTPSNVRLEHVKVKIATATFLYTLWIVSFERKNIFFFPKSELSCRMLDAYRCVHHRLQYYDKIYRPCYSLSSALTLAQYPNKIDRRGIPFQLSVSGSSYWSDMVRKELDKIITL